MNFITRLFNGPQLNRREALAAQDRQAQWLHDTLQRSALQVINHHAAQLSAARRSFSSADRPAWVASMPTSANDVNEELSRKLPIMRATAKDAARNNEWAERYLIQLHDNVLSDTGIQLQMRCKTASGEIDKPTNATLEAFWQKWGQRGSCEVTGRYCWQEIEALLLGALPTEGEFLFRHRFGVGPYGYQIQLLPAALLDVTLRRDWQGARVRMGVELTDDGAPVAYWLRAALAGEPLEGYGVTTIGKHVRITADQICHRFHSREVNQIRGIPWLDNGARRLWLLADFEEAAAVATSNAAKRGGFFTSPDGNAPPGIADTIVSAVLEQARAQGKVLSVEEINTLTSAAEKYSTAVPGQFDTLPTGYDFTPFESKWPDISAEGHIKSHVRAWSAARGVSFHTLGNDLSDVNYSSAQVGIQDERKHFKVIQGWLTSWLHQDVAAQVIRRAVVFERGLKPSQLQSYLGAIDWQPPTWRPIDPLKAANADDVALRNRSTSRRRIWLSQGLDPDDMEAEILGEEARLGPIEPARAPTAADLAGAAGG